MLRAPTAEAGLVQRARIVLLAAEGLPNAEIARQAGASRPTVIPFGGIESGLLSFYLIICICLVGRLAG